MKIIRFDRKPDYVFADDEHVVLVWPENVPGMDDCFRCRERTESGEIVDFRIYGYAIPNSEDEYNEIIDSINSGDQSAMEHL